MHRRENSKQTLMWRESTEGDIKEWAPSESRFIYYIFRIYLCEGRPSGGQTLDTTLNVIVVYLYRVFVLYEYI